MLDQRDHSIIAQASAHDAAEIYAALVKAGVYTGFNLADFEAMRFDIYGSTVEIVTAATEANQAKAVANVEAAFPGSRTLPNEEPFEGQMPMPPAPPAMAPPAPPTVPPTGTYPPPAPAGSDGSDVEALWREFFADQSKWWNNRADKTNPNAPDFKKKVSKDASPEEKKSAPALWINGRVPTPQWVKQALGAA